MALVLQNYRTTNYRTTELQNNRTTEQQNNRTTERQNEKNHRTGIWRVGPMIVERQNSRSTELQNDRTADLQNYRTTELQNEIDRPLTLYFLLNYSKKYIRITLYPDLTLNRFVILSFYHSVVLSFCRSVDLSFCHSCVFPPNHLSLLLIERLIPTNVGP